MRNFLSLLLPGLLAASYAHALDPGACNVQTTSRLDALLNPAKASDERYLSPPSSPPNILIALDTSSSMRWWPLSWKNDAVYSYSTNSVPATSPAGDTLLPGCRQEDVNALGYDRNVYYPQLWKSIGNTPYEPKVRSTEWFNTNKYYYVSGAGDLYPTGDSGRQVSFGMSFVPVPLHGTPPSAPSYTDVNQACQKVYNDSATTYPIPATVLNACKQCLQTQGYFQYARERRVMGGNFLNFYSPRGHTVASVLSQILDETPGVRFSFMTFSHGDPYNTLVPDKKVWPNGTTLTTPTAHAAGITMLNGFGPTCADSLTPTKLQEQRNKVVGNLRALAFNSATPLTELLYAAGHYFRNPQSPEPFATAFGTYPTHPDFNDGTGTSGLSSVCAANSYSAIILLTDGAPVEWGSPAVPSAIRMLGTPCEGCGTYAAAQGSFPGGSKSHVHRVADWLWNNDLRYDLPGTQRVATYTIGFALTDPGALSLLKATAAAGGGRFYQATHSASLRRSLQDILEEVQQGKNGLASFQTGSPLLNGLHPRMFPASNKPWRGELHRFEPFNEFVEEQDRNFDGDLADTHLVDRDGDTVSEQQSQFLKANGSGSARPFWEASEVLAGTVHVKTSMRPYRIEGRKLYTVTDSNLDGRFTHEDEVIEFSTANKARLKDYLGVVGTQACPYYNSVGSLQNGHILNALGSDIDSASSVLGLTRPAAPIPQPWLEDLCLTVLIEYVRGMDFSTAVARVREGLLGDIVHSSPVVVQPPVDTFLCDLGLSTQCMRTLYAQQRADVPATPLTPEWVNRCGTAVELNAYEAYAHTYRQREKLVLVGANDGMLHAFIDSVASEMCEGGLPFVAYSAQRQLPNRAREPGQELWAFIPPDLLPRLQEMTQGHTYAVDGDIMVRDVWADGSGTKAPAPNGQKEWDEFRTLAVVAEGRGGVHYFALELASNPSTGKFEDKPVLRWMYPQPDSEEAATFGKTLYAQSPKAPPVGPVLVEATTPDVAIPRYGVSTEERWMVMLSGGWSPTLDKGRGVYLVDAFHGQVNGRTDNLWWKFDYDPFASDERNLPRRHLTHSVVAPAALVDYGHNASPAPDGYFDTAVFGDTRGQLWVARFAQPGTLSSASPRLVENWAAARTFQMDRDNSNSVKRAWPFHAAPSIVVQPDGQMRAFLGTGNRYALQEGSAGTCRYDNPDACAKYMCGTVNVATRVDRVGANLTLGQKWNSGTLASSTLSRTPPFTMACGPALGEILRHDVMACPSITSTGVINEDRPNLRRTKVDCGMNAVGQYVCNVTSPVADNYKDIVLNPTSWTLGSLGTNRFFGLRIYGAPGQLFDESLTAPTSVPTAAGFDAARLTDRTGSNPSGGDLVDVTSGAWASEGSPGWVLDYTSGLPYKTATGAAVVSDCVLWHASAPLAAPSSSTTTPLVTLHQLHQAHLFTGAPTCASSLGGMRYLEHLESAPPAEPATLLQRSFSGALRQTVLSLPPGVDESRPVPSP
jgi:type IV pilus assembly protein PilY1